MPLANIHLLIYTLSLLVEYPLAGCTMLC